jgi:DNA-binding CsgD family transcriptional regulator
VIDLRLHALSDSAYQTASVCSAVGAEFTAPLIAQVRSEPTVITEESLQLCVSRGILRRVPNMEAPTYQFAHPLFLMRLYEMLRPTARRDLHRRIAEVAAGGDLQLSVDELARHYALGFGAEGGREAVDYCRAAAEHAEHLLAFESAARFWELALRCTKPRSKRQRAVLKRHLGWALWAAGKWNQASEVWSEAVLLFEALEDQRQIGKLALALGDMHRWRAELDRAEHWLKRALDTPLDRSNDRARALALLGSIHCLRNGSRQGLALLEEASSLVGSNGGDPLVAYWLSYGFMATGDRERAYTIAKTGFSDARRRGASSAVALLGGNLVLHELCRLQPKAARSYSRAVKGAIDPTDTTSHVRSLISEAWIFAYSGDWKRAELHCQDWMAQVRLAGRFQAATARVFWSEARFASEDARAAQVEIERALPDLDEMRPVASLHLARALVRLDEKEQAASLVRQHAPALSASSRSMAAAGRVMLGEVASRLDDPNLWRECYELLQREASPIVIAYSPVSVRRVLGRLASRLKLWPKAIEHFDTAVEELTQGDAHWELAQTYFDYAEMRRERRRRGDIRKGSAMQIEARAILGRLGMEYVETKPDDRTAGNRFGLTGRELEVLALVAEGRRNQEIAEALTVSYRTVTRHLENILAKTDAASRTEAVMRAVQEGLVGPLTPSKDLR